MLPRTLPCLTFVMVLVLLPVATARSAERDPRFYQAYYLEHHQADHAAAAELYREVLAGRGLDARVRQQAEAGLQRCTEEIAARDLARLMPPETLAYLELHDPGAQIGRLLDKLGLLREDGPLRADDRRVGVSPKLIRGLLGLRGAAIAITGFDPRREQPAGVAVLHPGDIDVIRGVLETVLPAAGSAKPIAGYPTYYIADGGVYVCLTARLVIAGFEKADIEKVLARLSGQNKDSFASAAETRELLAQRDGALIFACVNARKVMPLLMSMPGAQQDMAQARALLDLDRWRWVAARFGVDDAGAALDLELALESGHHNLLYNLVRTPPVTRDTLRCVPSGVVGFLAGAMNKSGSRHLPDESAGGTPTVTGLDVGREIFANVVDFSVFAMPPAGGDEQPSEIPDMAAVVRVHDPSRSQVLWNQLLGIASMAAGGAPTLDGTRHDIGGIQAQAYRFEDEVTVYVGTYRNMLLASTSHRAMAAALGAAQGGASILDDEDFSAALESMGDNTSKALFINPGRFLRMAAPHMSSSDRREVAPFRELLQRTVVSLMTHESEERLHVAASVSGLPDLGPMLSALIEREQRSETLRRELREARRHGQWDQALQAVDALLSDNKHHTGWLETRFDILALGKKDRRAAERYAQEAFAELQDPTALNNFAWALLTNERYEGQYATLALRLAEMACERTSYRRWAFVDTLALAKFEAQQDIEAAIRLQQQAIELHGGNHADMQASLQRYRAAAE